MFFRLTERFAAILLAVAAGFVDSACYEALFGLFTSNVTGNVVTAAAAIARPRPGTTQAGVASRLIIIPAFMAGVGLAAAIGVGMRLSHQARQKPIALLLFALEVLLIGGLWIAGVALQGRLRSMREQNDPNAINSWEVILLGCMSSVAMGMQNGTTKELFVGFPPTTIMTSVMVNTTSDFVRMVLLWCAIRGHLSIPYAQSLQATLAVQTSTLEEGQDHTAGSTAAPSPPAATPAGQPAATPASRPRFTAAAHGSLPDHTIHYLHRMPSQDRAELHQDFATSKRQVLKFGAPLLAFIAGAALGATVQRFGGFHSMAVPLFVLLLLWLDIFIAEMRHRRIDWQQRRNVALGAESGAAVVVPSRIHSAGMDSIPPAAAGIAIEQPAMRPVAGLDTAAALSPLSAAESGASPFSPSPLAGQHESDAVDYTYGVEMKPTSSEAQQGRGPGPPLPGERTRTMSPEQGLQMR